VTPFLHGMKRAAGWSAVLYDTATGGAGLSRLPCSGRPAAESAGDSECRKAATVCHSCLLAYDTQYMVERTESGAGRSGNDLWME
jgi:hypothetical protein